MVKICEICGHIEEPQVSEEQLTYEVVNVCSGCTEHLIHETDGAEG